MISFENPGVFDTRGMFVLGLSAKVGDNPIGRFGTGLKYGIAIAIREGWRIWVQPGDGTEHEIVGAPSSYRGKSFTIPRFDGRDLPFTTELGQNWEPWQAYRELVCNAWDEGGEAVHCQTKPSPELRTTRIIVSSHAIEDIHSKRDRYFWDPKGQLTIEDPDLFCKPGTGRLFFRGIFVGTISGGATSDFDYNTNEDVSISEDRTLTAGGLDTYLWIIRSSLVRCADPDLIERHIAPEDSNHFANLLAFHYYPSDDDSPYNKLANSLFDAGSVRLNASLARAIAEHRKSKQDFKEARMTANELDWKNRAIKIMADSGWDILEFPVVWKAVADRTDLLGCVRNGKIVIFEQAWEHGFETLLGTAIEEFVHIKYKYRDNTRQMQDWFVRQLAKRLAE